MGSLVAELAEKLSSATNNFDIDEGTIYVNTSADTVGIGTTSPGSKFDVQGTMQVGVNDTGHDVKFFGATAGAYLEWDESADELELRGGAATPGKLLLSTAETTVVDGNKLGQIDFQAPLDSAGTDAILVGASIYAEADATFSSSVNATELVFATGASETAAEKMRITSDGRVGIGTTSPGFQLDLQNGGGDGIRVAAYSTTAGDAARLYLNHSNNGTGGTQTAVDAEDILGQIIFQGSNGSAFVSGARIQAVADETFSGTAQGSYLSFFTVDNTTTTEDERMRIDHNGNVGIRNTAPEADLHIGSYQSGTGQTVTLRLSEGNGAGASTGFDMKYVGSSDNLIFTSKDGSGSLADRMTINRDTGRVGIGTNAPSYRLHVEEARDGDFASLIHNTDADNGQGLMIRAGADSGEAILSLRNQASDVKMIVRADGKVGIGGTPSYYKMEVSSSNTDGIAIQTFSTTSTHSPELNFVKSNNGTIGTQTETTSGHILGQINFYGVDTTSSLESGSQIIAQQTGAAGSAALHSDLRFRTSDGTSPRQERMLIDHDGNVGISTTAPGSSVALGITYYHKANFVSTNSDRGVLFSECTHASFGGKMHYLNELGRSSSSAFEFIRCTTDGDDDLQFYVRGDGYVASDGGSNFSNADYAEFFEWADGNPSSEDRTGYSVVLDDTTSNMIRKATASDDASSIIGVVSANPAVVGDSDLDVRYSHRWKKDDYGRHITEEYTVTEWTNSEGVLESYQTDLIPDDKTVPSDAKILTTELDGTKFKRKVEDDDYDKSLESAYVPRSKRKEWDTIGLMGKLRMKKGQPTGDRWVKMRTISSSVEEWLVR